MIGRIVQNVYFCFVALRPNVSPGLFTLKNYRSHTTSHRSRQDSSARVISSSQRTLSDNTQYSQQRDELTVLRAINMLRKSYKRGGFAKFIDGGVFWRKSLRT